MKVKLNKILFLNLCLCVFYEEPDIDDIQIRPSVTVGVKIDGKRMFIQ